MTAEEIGRALRGKEVKPGQWIAKCPAHDDHNPSLSIRQAGNKVLLHCFAGCSYEEIITALRQMGIFNAVRFGRNPNRNFYSSLKPKNLKKDYKGGTEICNLKSLKIY